MRFKVAFARMVLMGAAWMILTGVLAGFPSWTTPAWTCLGLCLGALLAFCQAAIECLHVGLIRQGSGS